MAKLMNELLNAKINRRQFLKGSTAATAAVAALGMGLSVNETALAETAHAPIVDHDAGGQWISAACWHNCGGQCMNKVLIKDGGVVRQKTDDTHPDSPDYPQQRGCVRGKAQQQQCFGPDRIK